MIFKDQIVASGGHVSWRHWSSRKGKAEGRTSWVEEIHGLDDNWFARYRLKFLAETDDARFDLVGWAEVDHQQRIDSTIDGIVQQLNHFGVPSLAQAALENGQLQPLSKTFHQFEYLTPAFIVANVVSDQVQMFVHHSIAG